MNCCGTGLDKTQPLPGDPDNNISLSAVGVFGGINLSWTQPAVNDHAVAYTIIWRGLTDDPALAIEIGRSTTGVYRDDLDNSTEYTYWIQNVSINGTLMDLVGPAVARARPKIDEWLQILSGQINEGLLAQSLKDDLANIEAVNNALQNEITTRTEENHLLAAAYGEHGQQLDQVLTQYTVKLTTVVQGPDGTQQRLVGGFGLINDNNTVQAGFDVDTFWVGRENSQGIRPFMVDSQTGEVLMNKAVIKEVTINSLVTESGAVAITNDGKIKADVLDVNVLKVNSGVINQTLKSQGYPTTPGWILNKDGSAKFTNVEVSGSIEATSLKADTAMVNTLNIVGGAITATTVVEISEDTAGTGFTQDINIDVSKAVVDPLVVFQVLGESEAVNTTLRNIVIKRGLTTLKKVRPVYTVGDGTGVYSKGVIQAIYVDRPGKINATYRVTSPNTTDPSNPTGSGSSIEATLLVNAGKV